MIYYNYSKNQLEEKAEDLLREFDAERLVKVKPIDVYAVIEKCLGVPYDWKYLTPDQSILGMTAFKSGYAWVWPKPYYEEGMLPSKAYFEAGTIVIDSTLTESDNRGSENFTVMHEVFHQVLHKRIFAHSNPDYTHTTTRDALYRKRKPMTPLERCEFQANTCAAVFLMPRDLVTKTLADLWNKPKMLKVSNPFHESVINEMAKRFSVSRTAMKYRLLSLGLAEE